MTRRTHVEGILLLYARGDARWPNTTTEHLASFGEHSRFPVVPIDTMYGFPAALERIDFAVILLHYSLFAKGWTLWPPFADYVARSRGYKVAFFQDDYRFCRQRFAFVDDHGIHCVYTPMASASAAATYGTHTHASRVEHTLTGYISKRLVTVGSRWSKQDGARTIDVGYRSQELPFYLGRSSRAKTLIGDEFARRAADAGLALDISTRLEDRIYGDDWYAFLGNCRASLGVESGTALVDLDGEVYEVYERLIAQMPDLGWDEFERRAAPVLDRWEGRIPELTVSPRLFEAAALGSCLILFDGEYAGVVEPDVHYIPLRKDFSNVGDVLARFRVAAEREALRQRAYDDVVASGDYSYERFIRGVDEVLVDAGALPASPPQPPRLPVLRAEVRARRGYATVSRTVLGRRRVPA